MRIRLYFDEDTVQHALVSALRKRGIDVLTALDAKMLKAPDERQLEFATAKARVIYSYNVGDFCRLHAQWLTESKSHAGIVLAKQKQFAIGEQMRRLVRIVSTLSAEEMANRLEFLSGWPV